MFNRLIAQPEDPKFFMLHWLKNLYSLDYIIINKEKEELENLRLEVKGYNTKKNEINKPNENLEELKNKIIDKPNDNELKSNRENENIINNDNNINNINNENDKEKKKEIEESKIESKNENDNINNENKNDDEPKKDLIDFSEESEN